VTRTPRRGAISISDRDNDRRRSVVVGGRFNLWLCRRHCHCRPLRRARGDTASSSPARFIVARFDLAAAIDADLSNVGDDDAKAAVTTTIRLRFDCDSTAVRLALDRSATALRPFDDLRYDRKARLRADCCTVI